MTLMTLMTLSIRTTMSDVRTTLALFGAAIAIAATACGTDGPEASTPPQNDATHEDTSDAETDATPDALDRDGEPAQDPDGSDPDTAGEALPRADGEPCVDAGECAGGTCLGPADGFPEGMCTYADCTSRRDCTGDERACLRGEFNGNLCVALCNDDADCRHGYECITLGAGAYCYPAYVGDALNPECGSELLGGTTVENPFGRNTAPLDRHRLSFDIGDDTTAFTIVAWDRRRRIFPDRVIAPDGTELNIYDYHNYYFTPLLLETISPLLIPAGPQYASLIQPGTYAAEFGMETGAGEGLCHMILEETAGLEPTDERLYLDVNFYFVGVRDLSAADAAEDSDFLDMLGAFDTAYAQANVQLGDVRYFDVLGDVAERFQILRDSSAIGDLVQLARQPGASRDELLSVNVFFVRGFAGEMSGTLGVSSGIPGVPGVHGSPGSGLVFSAGSLGSARGNVLVGQTLAHEVGHFLGLFHTTELRGQGADQFEDTPICEDIGQGGNRNCPDVSNLMFPTAGWSGVAEISPGQAMVIRANPLTKVRPRTSAPE